MKKIICTLVATLATLRLFGQGTFLVDQQSFDLATSFSSINVVGIGQSFTPSFSAIDYVQFGLADLPGSSVFVNLRQNSMSGTIIGSTTVQAIPLDPHIPTTFLFLNSIALTPGVQYFFEPVVVVNASQIGIQINASGDPYAGGTALLGGFPLAHDIWFSEGVIVPEPSTWALLGLGGSVLFAVRTRRPLFGARK